MDRDAIEMGLIFALASVAGIPFLALLWRARGPGLVTMVSLAWLVFAALLAVAAMGLRAPRIAEASIEHRPVEVERNGYVSSDSCKSCHPSEYTSWHNSYHRTMTQVATPETALGDFNDVELEWQGKSYRLLEQKGELYVELEDPDWKKPGPPPRVKRRVVLSTGSHHDQNYWYDSGREGRGLVLLPFDYSRREQRWVPFQLTFLHPPDSVWQEDRVGEWNTVCMNCHATRGQNRLVDGQSRQGKVLDTTVAEFGIACEACHGPAEEHVELNRNPVRRFTQHLLSDGDDTIVNPARVGLKRSSEICGSCHGIFRNRPSKRKVKGQGEWLEDPWKPGDPIHDYRIFVQARYMDPDHVTSDSEKHEDLLALDRRDPSFKDGHFWSDGMVRISGRDYSSMMESPCFERGTMECFSCHQMHQASDDPRPPDEWANDMLQYDKMGNGACTDCHPQYASAEKLTAHSHHSADSAGSNCYNCHMPHTTYGIQKAIRSHQIDSPDVRVSLETGRPNACNQCHLDQTLEWAADYLRAWYDIPEPELTPDQQKVAASILWALEGRAGQRALMAWSFGWDDAIEASGSEWMTPYLGYLLSDPYDSVRFMANQSLLKHAGFESFEYDFVSDVGSREKASFDVRILSDARPAFDDGRARPRLLLDDRGRVNYSELRRHAKRRDDTPVNLLE